MHNLLSINMQPLRCISFCCKCFPVLNLVFLTVFVLQRYSNHTHIFSLPNLFAFSWNHLCFPLLKFNPLQPIIHHDACTKTSRGTRYLFHTHTEASSQDVVIQHYLNNMSNQQLSNLVAMKKACCGEEGNCHCSNK